MLTFPSDITILPLIIVATGKPLTVKLLMSSSNGRPARMEAKATKNSVMEQRVSGKQSPLSSRKQLATMLPPQPKKILEMRSPTGSTREQTITKAKTTENRGGNSTNYAFLRERRRLAAGH